MLAARSEARAAKEELFDQHEGVIIVTVLINKHGGGGVGGGWDFSFFQFMFPPTVLYELNMAEFSVKR